MKTKISLAPQHPVTGQQQSEISLHGGFDFLGAASSLGPVFRDDTLRHDGYSVSLRAPGGEAITIYVDKANVDDLIGESEHIGKALRKLRSCAEQQPDVSRYVNGYGELEAVTA
ncbi:MAG: hypothetical protein JWN27_2932 [Candidatus Eremiobacteraeota bacterium]|nr:hypothetical protein [Candidatus Eremiobacteraeota bacterium]